MAREKKNMTKIGIIEREKEKREKLEWKAISNGMSIEEYIKTRPIKYSSIKGKTVSKEFIESLK